jgi:hypothetical protein
METWKKILLRATGFGVGLAITAAVIVGLFAWWSGRPKKPQPWNKSAITASFDDVESEGEQNTLIVVYTFQNNTDTDVEITNDNSLHLGALLSVDQNRSHLTRQVSSQPTIQSTFQQRAEFGSNCTSNFRILKGKT